MLLRLRPFLAVLALTAGPDAFGQTVTSSDLLNLREDINGLQQRMADLSLRIQTLESRQESAMRQAQAKPNPNAVTNEQLQDAVAGLTAQIAELRDKLAAATKAPAPAAAAAPAETAPAKKPAGTFSTDFPKQGTAYTVQKGDTVDLIARKTGAKFQDIVNANKLAEPSHIFVGQKLFIPGGK